MPPCSTESCRQLCFHLLCLKCLPAGGSLASQGGPPGRGVLSSSHTRPASMCQAGSGADGSGWPGPAGPVEAQSPCQQALPSSACPVPYLGLQASQPGCGGHIPDHIAGTTGHGWQLSLEEKKEHGDGELVVLEANVVGVSPVSPPLFPRHTMTTVCATSGDSGWWLS